jgi:hypothetical protein
MLQLKGLPTMAETKTAVPEGYLRNALGHLVPREQVREHDLLRDATVRTLAEKAVAINKALVEFKAAALGDIADLIKISGERYGVKMGGEKGNVSVTTFDGRYKMQRTYAEQITFTEEIKAAEKLIYQCIQRWGEGANPYIRTFADRAFRANIKGELKMSEVLDLLRYEIDDKEWAQAMQAIRDSIQANGTAVYVRVYERIGQSEKYRAITLDLAAV